MARPHVIALVVSSLVVSALPGCAPDEEEPDRGNVVLRGEYATKDGAAEIRSVRFDSPTDYRLRRQGCAEPACEEHGKYTVDTGAHRLDFVADGGRAYSLPFEVTSTTREEGEAPSGLTTKTLIEEDGESDGLVKRDTALFQLLVATGVRLLNADYEGGAKPVRQHIFSVIGKLYIAPIAEDGVGSFPAGSYRVDVANARLREMAALTNEGFSEDPPNPSLTSQQFRIRAGVKLDVKCEGSKVTMQLYAPEIQGGSEGGGYMGVVYPLKTDYTTDGRWAMQASGNPDPRLEWSFQFVHYRMNKRIWFQTGGHVTCNAYADAYLHNDQTRRSSFPSYRLWIHKTSSDGADSGELLIDERRQGPFARLWSLETVPKF